MSTIFTDTFNASSDTELAAHTPDTGTSWTRIFGANVAGQRLLCNAVNDNCRGENSGDNGAMYTADATYDSADYYLEFTMVSLDTDAVDPMYAFVRVQDVDNLYGVRLSDQGGTGTCQLYKKVSGTWSTVGSAFNPPGNGSVCKLDITGTTLTFYDDGASVASGTVSDFATAGKAGIGSGGGTELVTSIDNNSNTNQFDDLSVVTATTPTTALKDPILSPGMVPFAR